MIEATYGINEYISAQVTLGGLSTGKFYPGSQAPMTEDSNNYVLYKVTQNEKFDLFGLKTDTIVYTFYNSSFENLQRVVSLALKAINVENIQSSSLSEPGITYKDAYMRVSSPGEGADIDGEEFYFVVAEVSIKYTEA